MKRKILIVILGMCILACTGACMHFYIIGPYSKPTIEVKQECLIEEKVFKDRKIFTISSQKEINDEKVIVYFHGGSYIAELSNEHWDFVKELAEDTNMKVIVPDYPLIPKYNKDNVEKFSIEFYKELIQEIDAKNIIMMGDSAGGGLALGLCEKLAEENIELPSKLLLISPWLDVSLTNSQIDEVQKNDKQLNKETLKLAGIIYASKEKLQDCFASPVYGNVENLKDMQITVYTGTYDILNPDVHILLEKAKESNFDIELKEAEQKEHIWIILETENRKQDIYYQDLINKIIG